MSEAERQSATLDGVMAKLEEISARLRRLEIDKGDGAAWLTVRDVAGITTLSQREIYRRMKAGTFPPSTSIGGQRRAWSRETVQKWMRQQQKAKAS